MGSGCTKTEAGDVQQSRGADAVDGEQANGTHSADSKKGTYITTIYSTNNRIYSFDAVLTIIN